MKWLLILICLFVCSCEKLPGKYIYYDKGAVVHIDNKCKYITEVKSAKPVRRLDINDLYIEPNEYLLTCSKCIGKTAYDIILNRGRENRYNKSYDYAKRLHIALAKIPDVEFPRFKRFCQLLNDESYRQELYGILCEKYKLPAYSSFSDDSLGHIDLYMQTSWDY